MPMTQQSVVLTKPDANTIQIAIGSETHTLPIDHLKRLWNGERSLDILLFQFHRALQAAGVNPNTATAAQIKTAIEAQSYWWGN